MSAERHDGIRLPLEVEAALADILSLPGDQRDAAVDRLCARTPDHEELIRAVAAELPEADDIDDRPRIDDYSILGRLGEGGMGTVWLAEQREPIRRRVAIKVVKRGMDSRRVLRRFEAERQALAMMNHDNIAKIHGAGTTASGQPYFVMEFARGTPITAYSDRQRLSIDARLRLFLQVCSGVQHAHQRGVIHRDLKPSNVLVTIEEDHARPKIIDFGLARAVDHRLAGGTLHTEIGEMLGTPEYMPPEQADLTTEDVDTRADIWALGVMLYELLTGHLPFARNEGGIAGLLELRRRILNEEPQRPSACLERDDADGDRRAHARRESRGGLVRILRDDLDWIVMHALEKDRTHRYATAHELAADVERHLRNEAVLAGPPTTRYRLRKFWQRHRLQVGAALAVFASLVVGLALSLWFYAGAAAAREAAEAHAAAAERLAIAEAESRARAEQALRRFDLLAVGQQLRNLADDAASLEADAPIHLPALRAWMDDLEALRARRAELVRARDQLQQGVGAGTISSGAARVLVDSLTDFVDQLDALAGPSGASVTATREDIAYLEHHDPARWSERWDDAASALRRADGRSLHPGYAARAIRLQPQYGLIPIGPDPRSRLLEFYHPRSGSPDHGVPRRRPDGTIPMTEGTGVIFVLLPGGRYRCGAQFTDPGAPRYDPDSGDRDALRAVDVPPMFVSKHELTRAQWRRLCGGEDPSFYRLADSQPDFGLVITATNPVESVGFDDCRRVLRRHGMQLPSLDLWEVACRAGTDSIWHSGDDRSALDAFANLADATAAAQTREFKCDLGLEDGHIVHAPVGSFTPNAWGLHDMHGNVAEWCADAADGYAPTRGASFAYGPERARVVNVQWNAVDTRQATIGVRPVRALAETD